MTRTIATFTATALGTCLIAAPAFATDVVVEDFIGTITLVEGAENIDVERDHSKLSMDEGGESLRIDGGFTKPSREKVCSYKGFRPTEERRLRDYPVLRLSVPEGSTLELRNSIVKLDVDVALASADLKLMGCFDTTLADVLELDIGKSGSGDLSARDVGAFTLKKSGSGTVRLREVGTMRLGQSGSGDLEIGRVGRALEVNKSGSGDIEVAEFYGDFSLRQSGSGNVDIDGGAVDTVDIRKSGSGNVSIDAETREAKVSQSGSGNVTVARVTGDRDVSKSGSGKVRLGD